MRPKQPSKLELAILSLLWNMGPLTARAVLETLPDGKQRVYTSVLSVLQSMERKMLVRHTMRANTNVYHAVATRESTLRLTLRDFVRDVFNGSPAIAVQQLLSEADVSEPELEEVERIVSELRRQRAGIQDLES